MFGCDSCANANGSSMYYLPLLAGEMRNIIVYAVIVLLYKAESRTFCDDLKCACVNKGKSIQVTCSYHPTVLQANYSIPDSATALDLSLNNLVRIQRSLVSDTLIELLLVNNQIREIVTDAFHLPKLKILDLSHNDLEFIHRDTFAQIKYLEYLNLTNNKFTAYGNINFYHLKFLKELVLDDNNIGPSLETHKLFEGGYELTNGIESISLRNVSLNSKNKNIFAIANLKKIILAHNNLTNILDLPLNLEYLDISNNPIKNISRNDFFDVVYLSVLKLNNILIEEVSHFTFFYLSSLRELELKDNIFLKSFSPLAWGRIILQDQIDLLVQNMTLRGSNFSSLDRKLEGIFKKIKRVDLRDNPWQCDCELAWLQYLQIPKDLIDFRCSTPENLFKRRVLEVNSSEFICEPRNSSKNLNTGLGIVVYCFLLASAVLVMYFFIFSPRPLIYWQLPVEFPRTP